MDRVAITSGSGEPTATQLVASESAAGDLA
jgi:hypothetical protein